MSWSPSDWELCRRKKQRGRECFNPSFDCWQLIPPPNTPSPVLIGVLDFLANTDIQFHGAKWVTLGEFLGIIMEALLLTFTSKMRSFQGAQVFLVIAQESPRGFCAHSTATSCWDILLQKSWFESAILWQLMWIWFSFLCEVTKPPTYWLPIRQSVQSWQRGEIEWPGGFCLSSQLTVT